METLSNFIKRHKKRDEIMYPVKEGGFKNQQQLYQEYECLENETKCKVSFEGWCQLRKTYRK